MSLPGIGPTAPHTLQRKAMWHNAAASKWSLDIAGSGIRGLFCGSQLEAWAKQDNMASEFKEHSYTVAGIVNSLTCDLRARINRLSGDT